MRQFLNMFSGFTTTFFGMIINVLINKHKLRCQQINKNVLIILNVQSSCRWQSDSCGKAPCPSSHLYCHFGVTILILANTKFSLNINSIMKIMIISLMYIEQYLCCIFKVLVIIIENVKTFRSLSQLYTNNKNFVNIRNIILEEKSRLCLRLVNNVYLLPHL